MADEVTVKLEGDSASSTVPNPPPQPQAEQVIQAAIQTGAAAEKTEQAAAKAETAASEAKDLTHQLRESLMPELKQISERLSKLEAMEAEEAEERENDTLDSQENVSVVSLSVPRVVKKPEPQAQVPPPKKERGGFLKRAFLNL